MKNIFSEKVLKLYNIVLAVCTVAIGFALMAACYKIYAAGGEQPYTPETVAAAFSMIATPVYLYLALLLGSFILRFFTAKPQKEAPLRNQPAMTLLRMQKRRDLEGGSDTVKAAVLTQRQRRKMLYLLCLAVCAVCAAIFLAYALNPSHFHQTQINSSMVSAMYVLLPCLAVAMGSGMLVSYRVRASMLAESELLKQCPKRAQPLPEKSLPGYVPVLCKGGLVFLGIALLVYGFLTGGTADVLTKAVNICTECVGLG